MVKASGDTGLYYPGMYLKKSDNGKPFAEIQSERNRKILFEEKGASEIHVSISHEDDYAVAFVII
jgi:phosphopantetheinyl transferase (holo-ACP synthase)